MWFSTNLSHSGSQTSHWHRNSHTGLAGRSEAPCSSTLSHMTAGSFGQTSLLCMLRAIREVYRCVYLDYSSISWEYDRKRYLCLTYLSKLVLLNLWGYCIDWGTNLSHSVFPWILEGTYSLRQHHGKPRRSGTLDSPCHIEDPTSDWDSLQAEIVIFS